jgi:hypothetical protein
MRALRYPIDGQKIHCIHQQHPQEYGKCKRSYKATIAMKDAFNLLVDETQYKFDESLALVGHAGCGATNDPPQQTESDDS